MAKPFKAADLIFEAAKAITAAAENIARVKSFHRQAAGQPAEGIKDAIDT